MNMYEQYDVNMNKSTQLMASPTFLGKNRWNAHIDLATNKTLEGFKVPSVDVEGLACPCATQP